MSLKEKLKEDMKLAMKAKDSSKLSAIRMVNSAIKNREIELKTELNDEQVVAVIASDVKKRRDSVDQFKKGGRDDLVAEEEAQIKILAEYLPAQMSEGEVANIVKAAIEESGASSMKEMGAVMKLVMAKVKGKADGGLVNRLVKQALTG